MFLGFEAALERHDEWIVGEAQYVPLGECLLHLITRKHTHTHTHTHTKEGKREDNLLVNHQCGLIDAWVESVNGNRR